MENPVREQIKLTDRWQARPLNDRTASVFVPGAWEGKTIVVEPSPDSSWLPALAEGLVAGAWNIVTVPEGGTVADASLVAREQVHIADLQVRTVTPQMLSIRVRLAGGMPPSTTAGGGEAPCLRETGLLTLCFTLTAADGRQAAGAEIAITPGTCDVQMDMPLLKSTAGAHRLKVALCAAENIVDNARLALVIPENSGRISASE